MQRFLGQGAQPHSASKDVHAPSGNLAGSGRVVATRQELCQASGFLSLGPPVVGHGGPHSEMPVFLPQSCAHAPRTLVDRCCASAREQPAGARETAAVAVWLANRKDGSFPDRNRLSAQVKSMWP